MAAMSVNKRVGLCLYSRKFNLFAKPQRFRVFAHSWLACSLLFGYFLYLNASTMESDSDCSRVVCSSQVQSVALSMVQISPDTVL